MNAQTQYQLETKPECVLADGRLTKPCATRNPDTMTTKEQNLMAFAEPGAHNLIDIADDFGRSHISGETLNQIRERYPNAQLVNLDDWCRNRGQEQDETSKGFVETTEEKFNDMLNVLPPAAMKNGAFLVGEPWDHHATTGKPRFACFFQRHGKFFTTVGPITHAQFCEMFGKTSFDYIQ